jgi:hypothetical protein
MIPLIIGAILVYAFFNSPTEQVPGSKNFHMSDGASAAVYKQMKEQGMSDENLRRFVIMEDYLLELEKVSVCTGIPRIGEAVSMSQQIKDAFVGYDFSYHTFHLKQVADPSRVINKFVSC